MDEEITKASIHLQQELKIFYSLVTHKGSARQIAIRWPLLWHAAYTLMRLQRAVE